MISGMWFLNSDSLLNATMMLASIFVGSIAGFTHGLEVHPSGNGIFCGPESGGPLAIAYVN